MFGEYARMGGFGGGFLEGLFADISRMQAQKRKEAAGVTIENGLEGIPRLGIPNQFHLIAFGKDGYIFGLMKTGYSYRTEKTEYHRTVYDKMGKLLFECDDCNYLEQGMFLAGKKKEVVILGQSKSEEYGYALYKEGERLTEAIFRPHGMSEKFNSSGFMLTNAFGEWSKEYVIDKTGKIIYTKKGSSSIYIYEAILLENDKYINLWTGEVICDRGYGYDSKIDTKDHFWIKVDDNCVYQINKKTCEVIIHGVRTPKEPKPPFYEPKPVDPEAEKKRAEEKKIREKLAAAGRNDDCPICAEKGVTIKFKKCNEHFNQK